MFWHVFLNQLKIILRNKTLVFWTLSFPIILGFLFNLAFSNLNSAYVFEAVNIAVVNDAQYQSNSVLSSTIKTLSEKGDSQVFETKYVNDETQAEKLLSDKTIDGYLKIKDDKPTVVVQGSGINQTIIKTAIDQTLEMNNAVTSAIMHNPNLLHNKILDKISNSGDYMNDITNKSSDRTVLYFYTLIGMACLYSGFFGIVAVNQNEANLSKLGSRLCVSPTKRSTTLMASLMAGLAVSYIGQLLLYVFLAYILKINFGQNGWAILLIMLFGCLAGVMLGMLVSACNKKGENFKTGLLLGVTMFFSFLAGMMGTRSIKYLIDVNMPVLAYINPVNLISDALFSTYYFGLSGRYWTDLIALIGFIVVSVLLSWIFLRKRKYASL